MKDRITIEKRFWNRFARYYDRFIRIALGVTYDRMVEHLLEDLRPDDDVLDLATGTGLLAFAFCSRVRSVTGVDLSEKMVALANDNRKYSECKNLDFKVEDACQLSFPAASFDVVVASNVLHLLQEPETALREMQRVLRPGGRLILPTFCHGQDLKARLTSAVMGLAGFRASNKWSAEGLESLIMGQGLQIRKSRVIDDIIPLLYIVVEVPSEKAKP